MEQKRWLPCIRHVGLTSFQPFCLLLTWNTLVIGAFEVNLVRGLPTSFQTKWLLSKKNLHIPHIQVWSNRASSSVCNWMPLLESNFSKFRIFRSIFLLWIWKKAASKHDSAHKNLFLHTWQYITCAGQRRPRTSPGMADELARVLKYFLL